MTRKYGLIGAVLALFLVPQIANAPSAGLPYRPARSTAGTSLERYVVGMSKEQVLKTLKEDRKRFLEERRDKERSRGYSTTDFWLDSEELLLARMLFGEADICTKLEKIKIAWTALNRLKKGYEKTLKEVLLAPKQYSCFNSEMDEYLKYPLLNENFRQFFECLQIAREVLERKYPDPTGGATNYYNPKIVKKPSWAYKMKRLKGDKKDLHIFFK